MKKNYTTDQEDFWAGNFGEEYIDRNTVEKLLSTNLWFFSKALDRVENLSSVIEFGPNIGANLVTLHYLFPELESSGVEINEKAANMLKKSLPQSKIYNESILDFELNKKYDLSLIKGVLIHQDPSVLDEIYKKLYKLSNKYILIAEYYNPSPVEIEYRGNKGKLFKRDFAGEFLTKFDDVKLIDYGFAYKKDPKAPQDDITWFLFTKNN
tara:strand:+ start:15220 stop:15849 length:630 start_codon:yes stop_codon:yes gene_type:complete